MIGVARRGCWCRGLGGRFGWLCGGFCGWWWIWLEFGDVEGSGSESGVVVVLGGGLRLLFRGLMGVRGGGEALWCCVRDSMAEINC